MYPPLTDETLNYQFNYGQVGACRYRVFEVWPEVDGISRVVVFSADPDQAPAGAVGALGHAAAAVSGMFDQRATCFIETQREDGEEAKCIANVVTFRHPWSLVSVDGHASLGAGTRKPATAEAIDWLVPGLARQLGLTAAVAVPAAVPMRP